MSGLGSVQAALASSAHDITVNDWVLSAGFYEIVLAHGLESTDVSVLTKDLSGLVATTDWVSPTTNTVRLFMPAQPDCRFAGRTTITRII